MSWIAVDLESLVEVKADGTFGKPIDAMVQRVKTWLADGKDVRVFIGAAPMPAQYDPDIIDAWTEKHLGASLHLVGIDWADENSEFDFAEIWSHRCVQIEKGTGRLLAPGKVGFGVKQS